MIVLCISKLINLTQVRVKFNYENNNFIPDSNATKKHHDIGFRKYLIQIYVVRQRMSNIECWRIRFD